MRLPILSLALLSLPTLFAGCGPGQECAIDTDCAPGLYCSVVGACLERGTSSGTDSGPRDGGMPGDGGPRDATVGDAPTSDAPRDAPVMSDAPTVCPAVAGSYMLTSVGVGCTGLGATTMTLAGPAPSECAFEVMLDTSSVGVVALTTRETFNGMLSVAGVPTDCTLVFAPALDTVAATCGACMFSATAR